MMMPTIARFMRFADFFFAANEHRSLILSFRGETEEPAFTRNAKLGTRNLANDSTNTFHKTSAFERSSRQQLAILKGQNDSTIHRPLRCRGFHGPGRSGDQPLPD